MGALFIRCVMALFLLAPLAAQAAERPCTSAEKTRGDRALELSSAERNAAIKRHLPWDIPDSDAALLVQQDYLISYNSSVHVPLWTAHAIELSTLGKSQRISCFRPDPRLDAPSAASSTPKDFDEPIYDQGHMTPNGDVTKSVTSVVNSFIMTNMAPQRCRFNRGIWQMFESLTRIWAGSHSELYVLSGSVFDYDGDGKPDDPEGAPRMKSRNGDARVAIPSHFFKVLAYVDTQGGLHTLSILLPHNNRKISATGAIPYLKRNTISLAQINRISGLSLFPDLSERPAEADADHFWNTAQVKLRTLDAKCK